MTGWLIDLSANAPGTIPAPGLLASASAQADPGQIIIAVLSAAGVIAAIAGGLAFASHSRNRHRTNSHSGLFGGLCQHHNLDRGSRNLLMALGQAHRVRYAARVFLDPSLFEPKRLPPSLRWREDAVLALREQLFLVGDESVAPPQCRG